MSAPRTYANNGRVASLTVWFPCGHERTSENTKPVGLGRTACRACFRELDAKYRRNRRERERAESIT